MKTLQLARSWHECTPCELDDVDAPAAAPCALPVADDVDEDAACCCCWDAAESYETGGTPQPHFHLDALDAGCPAVPAAAQCAVCGLSVFTLYL